MRTIKRVLAVLFAVLLAATIFTYFYKGSSDRKVPPVIRCPEGIPPMDQVYLFRQSAQIQRIGYGRVAATDHNNGLVLVETAVAMGAVVDTAAYQAFLIGKAQGLGIDTGSDDYSFTQQSAATDIDLKRLGCEIHPHHFIVNRGSAKPLRPLLHLCAKGEAVDALIKARIIVDNVRQPHLTAGGQLLYHYGIQAGSGSIQRGGVTGGATADDQYIIDLCHISLPAVR